MGDWYDSIHCETWSAAKGALMELSRGRHCVFRGQRKSSWALATTLERTHPGNLPALVVERFCLWEFQRRAASMLLGPRLPQSRLDWLAHMQHYGAPTRLLDWTWSFYIAAYFAIEDAEDECAIWAIESDALMKTATRILVRAKQDKYDSAPFVDFGDQEVVDDLIRAGPDGAFMVFPSYAHERLAIQQGLFLMPGNVHHSFEANLVANVAEANASVFCHKVIVPAASRIDALRDLYLMNVSRATLFPGLDGFAESLRYYVPVFVDEVTARVGQMDT